MTDFLVGDVGGTYCRLGVIRVEGERLQLSGHATVPSPPPATLPRVLRSFLNKTGSRPDKIVLGIAGYETQSVIVMPNRTGTVDVAALRKEFPGTPLHVINDLLAWAWGVPVLLENQTTTIQEGVPNAEGNQALLVIGTGLGEAMILRHKGQMIPCPSEGGHSGFAPLDEEDVELFFYLKALYGRVSYERVLSGSGLVDMYKFERCTGRHGGTMDLARHLEKPNAVGIVLEQGLSGKDHACSAALNRFVRHVGAKAGDLALSCCATGGVYLGGGLATKLASCLASQTFVSLFRQKGRLSDYLARIPVHIILDSKTSLYGAARYGKSLEKN